MNRKQIADLILERLYQEYDNLQAFYAAQPIPYFYLDDLLPEDLAQQIRQAFPAGENMHIKKSLRELKYIAAQLNQYDPILEEVTYAFQDPRVVSLVGEITRIDEIEPDELLYAGGISMMAKGHFLNPHLDNSHDKERARYRVLNLLYYVSPDWRLENGGNLELWPNGPKEQQITVESRFNRLAVMATNQHSWHSVSPVQTDQMRCCVSNYYFSPKSPDEADYFHVTSFRGRPEQAVRDVVLQADQALRMGIRKIFPGGVVKNKHFYQKDDNSAEDESKQ